MIPLIVLTFLCTSILPGAGNARRQNMSVKDHFFEAKQYSYLIVLIV
jgi:hypothetical protein